MDNFKTEKYLSKQYNIISIIFIQKNLYLNYKINLIIYTLKKLMVH